MKKLISSVLLFFASCSLTAAQPVYNLQQLKDSALRNNISLRTARLQAEAAHEQRREAFTKYFPTISATGAWFNANRGMAKMDVDPSDMIPPEMGTLLSQMLPAEALTALSSPFSMTMLKSGKLAGITAMQPLFAGGQIVNGNRLAKVGEDVSRLQMQLSANEVERQAEQYYWQLVSLQQKMHTIEAVDTLLADIHKDVDVAVRAGVAMRNDLLQVELRQNDLQSQRLKLQNGIQLVRLLLNQFCGLKSDAWRVAYDMGAEEHDMSAEDSSLASLPEYQLLQKQAEAATLQKRMTIGQQLPTVAIGAGYNYHDLLDNDRTFVMAFATVSVPISDWWGGAHAIKRRKLEEQKAREQLTDGAEMLKIRMQKARNDVSEARQQLQLARRAIEQSKENLRLNRNYYRAGTSRMSDLLEAQLLFQQTLDRQTDAYADLQNRLLDYRQAIGQ